MLLFQVDAELQWERYVSDTAVGEVVNLNARKKIEWLAKKICIDFMMQTYLIILEFMILMKFVNIEDAMEYDAHISHKIDYRFFWLPLAMTER